MPRLPLQGAPGAGDWLGFFAHAGESRRGRYVLHVPHRLERPAPLVVALHGVSNTAASMARKTRLNMLAERHGFLVLYPEGMGVFGSWQHWNAGFCCGLAHERLVDDVAFVSRCIRDVRDRLPVDPGRVYMLGHSNGAMLAYAYGARRPADLRALAVVAGAAGGTAGPGLPEGRVQPQGPPLPLLAVHGGEDHVMPLAGGASSDPFLAQYGTRLPLETSLGIWLRHNGCQAAPVEQTLHQGRMLRRDWCPGDPQRAVRLLLLREWPHAWPGPGAGEVQGYELPEGFSAEEAIWSFFTELESPAGRPRNKAPGAAEAMPR